MRYPQIASRVFNTPLLLHPGRAHQIISALSDQFRIAQIDGAVAEVTPPSPSASLDMEDDPVAVRPYQLSSGVAVIDIEGALAHRYGYIQPACGMTGYDGISYQLRKAMHDPEVRAIALDIHSPGGEVSGCFALADMIRAAREEKPIWALVHDWAASAAYAIASSCSRVVLPDTGWAGSVGVIMAHAEWSAALAKEGVKVTLIYAGKHKADGNEVEPLPKEVHADLQAEMENVRARFVERVVAGRKITAEAVQGTEARCYMGPEAVRVGFADAVMNIGEAFAELTELAKT